jgi:pimeloyl-ACP methyl ester carboxylesterase
MRPERYPGGGPVGNASLDYAILRWPVLDPYARYLFAQTAMPRLVVATEGYFLTEAAMKEANPTLILERGEYTPRFPVLIVQGTADENIPMSIPERFVAAWRRAGGEVDFQLFDGMPHVFMWKKCEETYRAQQVIERFIARQLSTVASA